jgi:hypothetical protein
VLVELSVMEQRYKAVIAIFQDTWRVRTSPKGWGWASERPPLDRPLRGGGQLARH